MKSIITLAIFILYQVSYSQIETKIFHKNGSITTELCKIKGNTITCEIENKKVQYSSTDLISIEQYPNTEKAERYVYLTIENSNKPKLVKEIINGKVSLYEISKMAAPQIGGWTYTYYIKKPSWDVIKKIGTMTFKKDLVREYFTDCPSLLEKVENNYFKGRDPSDLINYFNENCEK